MTVHKALAELKIVDDRIISAINGGTYCVANKHSKMKNHGVEFDEKMLDVLNKQYNKAQSEILKQNVMILKRGQNSM